MYRYKIMSARKFLQMLPSFLKNGYRGNYYTLCISERFFKKIRREMCLGYDEGLTNIYIFCNGFVLDPKEQKNSGIYLRDCGGHFEIIMCRLHSSFFSGEDLYAMSTSNNSVNKETASDPLVSKEDVEGSDINLVDGFVGKELKSANTQTVFQNLASIHCKLYFL